MDAITVPVVDSQKSLDEVWQLMRDRGCANVLVRKGKSFYPVSDEIVAEAMARGARSLRGLSGAGEGIQILSSDDFLQGSSGVFSSRELRRMHLSIEKALSPFVGGERRRTRTPDRFAQRLTRVFDLRNLEVAIVALQFGTATVFSVSEGLLSGAGFCRGGPGRFLCSCDGLHVWQPHELHEGCCPLDACEVSFSR